VSDSAPEAKAPFLRVVKGDASPEELAALVAVLASVGSSAEPDSKPVQAWSAHHRKVRVTLPNGPGGWRSSALPR
jgi:acyl-CoA carboxylase epsilon subunit